MSGAMTASASIKSGIRQNIKLLLKPLILLQASGNLKYEIYFEFISTPKNDTL
jgi:hypothetical protein